MGKKVTALITDMNQPLGRAVGNALEVREALDILNGKGPADAQALTLTLAEQMLSLAGILPPHNASAYLQDGSALARFRRMVACHGGDPEAALPVSGRQIPLPAPRSGYVSRVDAEVIGRACLLLGAGRTKTTDSIDPSVGLSGLRKIGEAVEKDEPLCIIHSNGHEHESDLMRRLGKAFEISDSPLEPPALVLERIGPEEREHP
jgi:thymidine phosphorylase